jgi:hypothetical protein
VVHHNRYGYGGSWKPKNTKSQRTLNKHEIKFLIALGFFDEADQRTPGMCGVSGVLYLEENNYISLNYVVGWGTHNRVELYAMWLLVKCVAN